MSKGKRKAALGAVALLALASSIPAEASCWSEEAVEAAKIREFETMLMVSALRCRLKGVNFLPEYNAFVRGNRGALTHVNDTLREHFDDGFGRRIALDRYDRYVTSVANRYGAGIEDLNCYDMEDMAYAALETRDSLYRLAALADRAGMKPELDGVACRVNWSRGR